MSGLRVRLVSSLLLVAGCDELKEAPPPPPEASSLAQQALSTMKAPGGRSRTGSSEKRRPKSILLAEARELVAWRVADGYLTREDIIEAAFDAADGRTSLRKDIERMVDEELATHRAREATWRYLTDPDRLTRAFASLEKQGIIARERFSDCRKCGQADMRQLGEQLLEQGRRMEGYVFFTDQDADGVSESGELVLEFGSFRDSGDAGKKLAQRIEQALTGEGLAVVHEVDEDDEPYLVLVDLTWQKRRFTRPPAR